MMILFREILLFPLRLLLCALAYFFFWLSGERGERGNMLKALSEAELRELAALLGRGEPGVSMLTDIHALDGFLACVGVSAEPINPARWATFLLRTDAASPARQLDRAIELTGRRMNMIADELIRGTYLPLLETHAHLGSQEVALLLDLWCRGFTVASELQDRQWRKLLRRKDTSAWLRPIWSRSDVGLERGRKFAPQRVAEAQALNVEGIKAIMRKLHELHVPSPTTQQVAAL